MDSPARSFTKTGRAHHSSDGGGEVGRQGGEGAVAGDATDLLGMHINTAVRWVKYVGRDWADYIAARAIEQG
jgi:hypothetical protein